TLNEILNGTGAEAKAPVYDIKAPVDSTTGLPSNVGTHDSAAYREHCLQEAGVSGVRDWFDNRNQPN
ncbi:MAG: hypothetical protein II219_01025, partial [Alphaproteobacteria bacterium]|nr:hypothetical protein [Alphaproteobacteria bacterium]